MYTWAERSVMRCSQACVAVYLQTARRRSIPRHYPWTCSCRTAIRWTTNRLMRWAIHRWEIAADLRPFPFPCRGIFACIPIDKSARFEEVTRIPRLKYTLQYCSRYCGKGHFRRFSFQAFNICRETRTDHVVGFMAVAFYNLPATTITLGVLPLSRNCQHSYFIHGYLQSI